MATKRIKAAKVQLAERAASMDDMVDLLLTIPELNEAYTRADIELALDDRGWLSPSGRTTAEFDAQTRTVLVNKSRLYWTRDPLAKQAVRLWTDYALGTGITFKAEDATQQKMLEQFVRDRRNRRLMSSEGQRKSSKKLLVDGEVFFAIFGAEGQPKVIRWVDPNQITDIITDPEDNEHILAYRRQLPITNGKTPKAIYYVDWSCDDADKALAEQQKVGTHQEAVVLESDVVLYHIPFDAIHQRGNGLLFSVVDWTREHRRFMEARVAITQALSKYANKLTVKGGAGAVNAIKSKLQSTYANNAANTVERNPQTAPGSTWVQNDGIALEAIPKATGAGDSEKDGNQLKLMVCAGTGIMLHYYGDPSTGNLATATAMELPMLKMFDSYQELWKDAWRDIFSIITDEDPDEPADPEAITIELPPILADDLGALGTSLNSIAQLWPEIAESDEVLVGVLTAMRLNDPEEALTHLRAIRKLQQEEAKKQQDLNNTIALKKVGGPQGEGDASGNGNPLNTSAEAAMDRVLAASQVQAVDRLASALEESSQVAPAIATPVEAPPINLTVNIENKAGSKSTRKAKVTRDAKGDLNFVEESTNGD
jgi:hypothetical protein